MESELHMQLDLLNRMPTVNDGTPPVLSESLLRSSFSQVGAQHGSMTGLPLLSSFQGDPFKDLPSDKTVSYDGLRNRGNSNVHELCLGDSSLPSGSLGSILSSRNNLDNDLSGSAIPLQQEAPSESLREMFASNCSYASSSSIPTFINCGYDRLLGEANGKWDESKFLIQPELSWRASTSGSEPIHRIENHSVNQWVLPYSAIIGSSLPYGIPISHRDLSLSLATSEPSLPCSANVQGCSSDISRSSVICYSQSQARVDSSSQGNRELSLEFASKSRPTQFSHEMISGSKYFDALQQILSELASFSLVGVDQASCTIGLVGSSSNIPVSPTDFDNDSRMAFKGVSKLSGDDESFEGPAESSNRRQEVEATKSELLGILELVDDCCTRYLDEIHTVISAFHAATELDPQLHACFTLRTVSLFYKNLRERISNAILVMGMDYGSRRDNMRTFEKAFIQKHWALQQLKRKDQQLWRPQRGLPERSVAVLRAWMFENFLHPYPKDSEKHLLAIRSGLTRSQVSNWFINARVRLWKPLVEEMCAELNRRKMSGQNDQGANNDNSHSSHLTDLSMYDKQSFNN